MESNIYKLRFFTKRMDTQILEDIGLSATEIKVFLTLLELGETKAGKIIEKLKLQSSSVYNALNSLILKGFVSYIKKSEIKYYRSAEPENVLDYLESKKKAYLKILPKLKEKQKTKNNEGVEFYKSYKGIKILFSKLFKDAKKGDCYMTFNTDNLEEYEEAREKIFRFVKEIAKEKGIIQKGIFNSKLKEKKKSNSRMQKKYVKGHLPPTTIMLNEKTAIISWEEEPIGILIYSKDITKKYLSFFEQIWKEN